MEHSSHEVAGGVGGSILLVLVSYFACFPVCFGSGAWKIKAGSVQIEVGEGTRGTGWKRSSQVGRRSRAAKWAWQLVGTKVSEDELAGGLP